MARNEFSVMATRVTETLHDSSLNAKARDWLNETIQDIHHRTKLIYLHGTGTLTQVADQQEYAFTSIASNIEKILYIRDEGNSVSLAEISYSNLYDNVADMTDAATGNPTHYYIKNQVIGLYPVPDSTDTLAVDFKQRIVDLSQDTDTPALPMDWTDVILLGAESRGLRYLKRGDWQATQAFYEGEVRRRLGEEQSFPNSRHRFKQQGLEQDFFGPKFPSNF